MESDNETEVKGDDNAQSKSSDSSDEREDLDNRDPMNSQPLPRRKRFIPNYNVEGVHKVALGEETQNQIDMIVGKNVTVQYPWGFAKKGKMLESIDTSGESSEFADIYELIKTYPEDDILMGYIVDESNNIDEFYICCTIEARDHCKQQSDKFIKRQEKKLEKALQKKPRPWKTLESDVELYELVPIKARSLIEIEIKSKFPKIYEPSVFNARDTNSIRDGFIELTPYRQAFNNVYMRRVDCACQAAAPVQDRYAQTYLRYPKNIWTQSILDTLGKVGDPKGGGGDADIAITDIKNEDVSCSDEEHEKITDRVDDVGLQSYKESLKYMRRPSYIQKITDFISETKTEMDSIIELNTVMDMYDNDYVNLVAKESHNIYETMTFAEYVCFSDVRAKNKYISCAIFHPMWSGIVAISYSDESSVVTKTVSAQLDPVQRAVYGLNPVLIWSHVDSLIPKLYLESFREVKTLSFCPFNENILIGGCVNGQIVIWDLTKKLDNVESEDILSESRQKYRIAMNSHMGWMKNIHDNSVVLTTASSNLMTSHYGPVNSITWLSPNFNMTPTGRLSLLPKNKKSFMFFSGSEDGTILIWNLSIENVPQLTIKKIKKSKRVMKTPSGLLVDISPFKILNHSLQPLYKIILGAAGQPPKKPLQCFALNSPFVKYLYNARNKGSGRKYYTPEIITQSEDEIKSIVYIGTQYGEMARITWEGHDFNTGEVVNSEFCNIKYSCCIHDGIITSSEKNPFVDNITLTVGGKIFAIWSDNLRNRPLLWKKRNCHLTCGKWSLYKPSLIFITTSEGDLETWDLLLKSEKPIKVQNVSGNMLTEISLHTLPIAKNMIGVGDVSGSFRIFLNPPIFMVEKPSYLGQTERLILRELNVMNTFITWQDEFMKKNPDIVFEIKRKEREIFTTKEEEKRRLKEELALKLAAEEEARRLEKLRVIGPAERWQRIIQRLIERTIAVKKRINKEQLIEQEKPLRELEAQRVEKERRMLQIMKNQKAIFNDTVAILFPEAIQKDEKIKKSYLSEDKSLLKSIYLSEYEELKLTALKTVVNNPYKVAFSWDATVAEGKDRKQTLNAHKDFINLHKSRIEHRKTVPNMPEKIRSSSSKSNYSTD